MVAYPDATQFNFTHRLAQSILGVTATIVLDLVLVSATEIAAHYLPLTFLHRFTECTRYGQRASTLRCFRVYASLVHSVCVSRPGCSCAHTYTYSHWRHHDDLSKRLDCLGSGLSNVGVSFTKFVCIHHGTDSYQVAFFLFSVRDSALCQAMLFTSRNSHRTNLLAVGLWIRILPLHSLPSLSRPYRLSALGSGTQPGCRSDAQNQAICRCCALLSNEH
jgi:hypothetical protein